MTSNFSWCYVSISQNLVKLISTGLNPKELRCDMMVTTPIFVFNSLSERNQSYSSHINTHPQDTSDIVQKVCKFIYLKQVNKPLCQNFQKLFMDNQRFIRRIDNLKAPQNYYFQEDCFWIKNWSVFRNYTILLLNSFLDQHDVSRTDFNETNISHHKRKLVVLARRWRHGRESISDAGVIFFSAKYGVCPIMAEEIMTSDKNKDLHI